MKGLNKLIMAALFAAITAVATFAIRIPTPLSGYIHLGDSMVLLGGIILGPFWGALAGGMGSMFADIAAGYLLYAPVTFVIKAVAARVAGILFYKVVHRKGSQSVSVGIILAGMISGIIVVFGYFLYESILYHVAAAAANAIFNGMQGGAAIVVALALVHAMYRVPCLRTKIYQP